MDTQDLERVRKIATDIVEYAGMELVHLESKREPGGWILRLYIDKPGGVTLDDCASVSRQVSAQLDIEDPIEQRYTLEVSSPGLDRPLFQDADYVKFSGRRVRVTTFGPIDGQRNFVGKLGGIVEDTVRLTLDDGREVAVPRSQVAKARLEVEF